MLRELTYKVLEFAQIRVTVAEIRYVFLGGCFLLAHRVCLHVYQQMGMGIFDKKRPFEGLHIRCQPAGLGARDTQFTLKLISVFVFVSVASNPFRGNFVTPEITKFPQLQDHYFSCSFYYKSQQRTSTRVFAMVHADLHWSNTLCRIFHMTACGGCVMIQEKSLRVSFLHDAARICC